MTSVDVVPDPWALLGRELPDIELVRIPRLPEPARYYHAERVIAVRKGLLLEEERRYLWHEIVHAQRGDTACHMEWLRGKNERSVEREAAQRAMPFSAVEAQLQAAVTWHDFVDQMKVPEPWVRFRLDIAHPAEKVLIHRACRWAGADVRHDTA